MATASADVDRLHRRLASDRYWIELPSKIVADLSRVRRALYRLQGVLTTAEKQAFEASKEPLLRKIKQSVYDVEDILDEIDDGSINFFWSSPLRKLAGAADSKPQVSISRWFCELGLFLWPYHFEEHSARIGRFCRTVCSGLHTSSASDCPHVTLSRKT
jgi:hypothetical protein